MELFVKLDKKELEVIENALRSYRAYLEGELEDRSDKLDSVSQLIEKTLDTTNALLKQL